MSYTEVDKKEDVKVLHSMGYAQELERRLSRFSNFAVSFSIICILSGGINSLAQGTSGAGGIAIGVGWLIGCFVSLVFAVAMSQISSAYPTAGGLYHWGSILGNRGTGWVTAWLNLLGLITVLGAINVGTWTFFCSAPSVRRSASRTTSLIRRSSSSSSPAPRLSSTTSALGSPPFSRTSLAAVLRLDSDCRCLPNPAEHWDVSRLFTFTNYSGEPGGNVWPPVSNTWVFLLGLLLPIYTTRATTLPRIHRKRP